jgi:hypothetical protein
MLFSSVSVSHEAQILQTHRSRLSSSSKLVPRRALDGGPRKVTVSGVRSDILLSISIETIGAVHDPESGEGMVVTAMLEWEGGPDRHVKSPGRSASIKRICLVNCHCNSRASIGRLASFDITVAR